MVLGYNTHFLALEQWISQSGLTNLFKKRSPSLLKQNLEGVHSSIQWSSTSQMHSLRVRKWLALSFKSRLGFISNDYGNINDQEFIALTEQPKTILSRPRSQLHVVTKKKSKMTLRRQNGFCTAARHWEHCGCAGSTTCPSCSSL